MTRQDSWFADFRQAVRAHRPSELLPGLARLATEMGLPPYDLNKMPGIYPWTIPVIARESILWGNEHRGAPVTLQALARLGQRLNDEPGPEPEDMRVHSLLTRYQYEQFPYQESVYEEVSRAHAMLVEGAEHLTMEVLGDQAWMDLLGSPLGQAVGATFFLQVAADANSGWFDPAWLQREEFAPVFDRWPRRVIEQTAEALSYTTAAFRDAYRSKPQPAVGDERWAYNPLWERPFLRMPDGRLLAPQPRLILRTVSPGVLYYRGMAQFGEPFSRDLGHLVEHYVGRQLRSIAGADVKGEIRFAGKARRASIDWFLILPSIVVLFEVKSARLGLLHRAGGPGLDEAVSAVLNKAIRQLAATVDAIDSGDAAFAAIPTDRPRMAVIVTAEPFYMANTPWVRDLLEGPPVPTVVASLRDLEHLVTVPVEKLGELLVQMATAEQPTFHLNNILREVGPTARNLILDQAWASYPWPPITQDDD